MAEIIQSQAQIQEELLAEKTRMLTLAETILSQARQRGATAAEVGANLDIGYTVNVRQGEIETLEHHRDKGIGITVYFGHRKGSASTSDTRPESIAETIKAACNIAQFTNEDPYAGLADKALMAFDYPDLDLYHPWPLSPEQAIELAKRCEAHGFEFDRRITNSEGASVSNHQGVHLYANTHGFVGIMPSSRHGITCVLIAKEADSMQRDYSYTLARDPRELWSPEEVASLAAQRTVRRLGARNLPTGKVPVIFEADVARGLLGHLISAIRGASLYRRASFLLDHLDKKILPSYVQLIEKPHIQKALGSSPFDDEGVKTKEHTIVKEGILKSYVLDSYSARKLGTQTTGNAGGIHNVIIAHSEKKFNDLIKEMGKGLIVTELLGQGVNIVTGDYSRGACGFWVEQGEIQFPVEEITIAGNLKEMFLNLVAVGNDIDYRGSIRTGSILLEEMMVAGH